MPILRPLKLREIAHAIVSDKVGILEVLQKSGILISQEDEESIFRAVLENELNDKIKSGIFNILMTHPFRQHCAHCIEDIQEVYDKGLVIRKKLSEKS